ncbi:MAG: YceI family protein [Bacteroidetes bacterium]|nr:YceI family protein [Bacteroidota bacterium]
MKEQVQATVNAPAATGVKWTIDPAHSEIQFKVKHMMISTVTGSFGKFGADIEANGDDLSTAKIRFHADVESITTGNGQRDGHLKSTDFFSGEKHPQITFVSTGSKSVDRDGSWTLLGDLSMNGITKPVQLDVEWGGVMKDPYGNTKAGVSIHGKVNRKDWGINWNAALEAGGVMVSDEVRIACEVQLVKQG